MLLIGDIHIHPRYCDTTIDMLRTYIMQHPTEKNIVFVGDYVYHFSYHRVSLLALLDFFLELVAHDKEVYILAGNHDRLGQHFVYTEAEKMLNYKNDNHQIHFITEPCVKTIDTKTVIFLPYILNRSGYTPQSESYHFTTSLENCKASTNTQLKSSYTLNAYLADTIQKQRESDTDKELLVIHHYYTADTKFPGIKTQFGYKDLALSPHWMEDTNLRMVSGHIHHSFIYNNYLCVGAVWATSPLESNQLQYLFRYTNNTITATQIALNPYITLAIDDTTTVDALFLEEYRQTLQSQSQEYFQSPYYKVSHITCPLPIERTTMTIINNSIGYDTLTEYIQPALQQTLRETKIKQNLGSLDIILEELVDSNKDFSS
jgi:DNA repair exonuclease SbcCD nuclease subunit